MPDVDRLDLILDMLLAIGSEIARKSRNDNAGGVVVSYIVGDTGGAVPSINTGPAISIFQDAMQGFYGRAAAIKAKDAREAGNV